MEKISSCWDPKTSSDVNFVSRRFNTLVRRNFGVVIFKRSRKARIFYNVALYLITISRLLVPIPGSEHKLVVR